MNRRGELFVGQRKGQAKPAWQMPQGGIDKGEDPVRAALRELVEETGVTADLVEVVGITDGWLTYDLPEDIIGKIWNGKYRGQKQKWILMRYLGTDDQVQIETDHPEFSDWRWVPPHEVLEQIVAFKRPVYLRVLQEFERYFGKVDVSPQASSTEQQSRFT